MLPPKKDKDESDNEDLDWGEVYTELICHTSLRWDDIGERTIPQLKVIRTELPKQISSKLFGFTSGESEVKEEKPTRMQTTVERMAFAARFNS